MPNNNKNGEDMIIDIELTAKPITDDFWILTQNDKKVGNVCANSAGYGVQLAGSFFQFESTKDIQKKTKIKFVAPEKIKLRNNSVSRISDIGSYL
jgi:hypothetical protein